MDLKLTDINKITLFTNIFVQLKKFTSDISMDFSKKGLYIQSMDSNHVCIFECVVGNDWFDSYTFKSKQDDAVFQLGISSHSVHKVMSVFDKSQSFNMKYVEEGDYLEFNFTDGDKKTTCDKDLVIPLYDFYSDALNLTTPESDVDLIIESKKMGEIITQLKLFNESVLFNFNEETIVMKSTSEGETNMIGEDTMAVNMNFDDVIEYGISSVISDTYNINYLVTICGFGKLAKEMKLEFTKEKPMVVTYNIGECAFVKFYVAPKANL